MYFTDCLECHIFALPCTLRFTAWLVGSCFSPEFVCSWILWWNEPVAFSRLHCFLLCCYFSEHHPHDTFYQFRQPKRLVIYHSWSKRLLFPFFPLFFNTCFSLCYFSLSLTYSSSFLCSSSLNMLSAYSSIYKWAVGCSQHFFFHYFIPTAQFCLCMN